MNSNNNTNNTNNNTINANITSSSTNNNPTTNSSNLSGLNKSSFPRLNSIAEDSFLNTSRRDSFLLPIGTSDFDRFNRNSIDETQQNSNGVVVNSGNGNGISNTGPFSRNESIFFPRYSFDSTSNNGSFSGLSTTSSSALNPPIQTPPLHGSSGGPLSIIPAIPSTTATNTATNTTSSGSAKSSSSLQSSTSHSSSKTKISKFTNNWFNIRPKLIFNSSNNKHKLNVTSIKCIKLIFIRKI
ncbi:unnamed protein product [[Candida] boidinii]|uniref:Unnamed protein product n=1 Tax=Candida boidinii TaxID=5477 RepID=A0A9W6T8A7_CANBO|nr:unnamed protein product [[Candida] boidinii]